VLDSADVPSPYRALFAEPALRRLALADVCARLPQGMTSITLLLVAAQHASMTVAGLVVAGYTLGQAVTASAAATAVIRTHSPGGVSTVRSDRKKRPDTDGEEVRR
jgi:hypothetical protein